MADLPSFNDLFRVARDETASRSSELTLAILNREGSDANAITAGSAAVGDECIGQLSTALANLYLDTCSGEKLDRLVADPRFGGLIRKSASPSVGYVTFSLSSAAVTSFLIPSGTTLSTTDGKTLTTTTDATFASGSTTLAQVPVQTTLAGLDQQCAVGTITNIVSAITGSPDGLTVTNPLATSLADDDELDDALRDRARLNYTTQARGTLKAIRAAALGVSGIRKATVFEVQDVNGYSGRLVELVISDAFTDSLVNVGTSATYQAQASLVTQTIQDALDEVRACGISVNVTLATVAMTSVQLSLRYSANTDAATAAKSARQAVVATINGLSPGETLTVAAIENALAQVPGLVVLGTIVGSPSFGCDVVSPTGNIIPASSFEVIRTMLSLVTVVSS